MGRVRERGVADLEDIVGERLMFGLPGPTLRDEDVSLFKETRAAGLIVYRRNFDSPAGLLRLLGSLEGALGRRLLVATDHEGGRVVMLGGATTIFPDNLAVGTAGEEAFAHRQGRVEARELRRLGVDLNLAPVLDVLTERYSPNIGIRSYGKDPAIVARYGAARIRGMKRDGLSACAKHFPGKGHAPLDAHLALPIIESTWAEMHMTHLPPFLEAIAAGVDCVMTSHPVYPNLDPARVPATFSRLIVEDYLRGELRFRGVIVSDDLEMGAIAQSCPLGEAAVRAAQAGHDLLLICHTEAAQRAAAAALFDAYQADRLPRRGLEAAAERVRRLREQRRAQSEGGPPVRELEGPPLAMAIASRAVTPVTPGRPGLRRALNGSVSVVFPRFSELAQRITIEPEVADEPRYLTDAFASVGIAPTVLLVGIEPTVAEIAAAAERAAAADATVLFLYDAALLPAGVLGITAYGFRKCQLDAAIARLAHP